MEGIVCRAVGTTPSLDGGAEAAAGGSPFSVAESAVVEVGLPASTLLFTQDVVLSVCEVSRHTDVECVRHRLPSIPLLQHRYLVTPPVESGDQRSWAVDVTALGACAVCSFHIIPGPRFLRVESAEELNNLPHTVLIGFVTFLVHTKKPDVIALRKKDL